MGKKIAGSSLSEKIKVLSRLDYGRLLFTLLCLSIFFFLVFPSLIVIICSFSPSLYVVFPPTGFSFVWFHKVLTSKAWMSATRTSLSVSCFATPMSIVLGTLASYALVRYNMKGKDFLMALITSPLVMPRIVLGIGMLFFYVSVGLQDTFEGLFFAHIIVTMPYVVRSVSVNLYNLDINLERAAKNLGANEIQTFMKITLPQIKPGIIAGGLFAFIMSFGELGMTLLIAGARITTLPIRIFTYVEYSWDPAVTAISSIYIILALIVLFIVNRQIGIEVSGRVV